MPPELRAEWVDRILMFTEPAHPWLIRANATAALLELTSGTPREAEAGRRVEELTRDEVTLVRRVAENALARAKPTA